MKVVFCLGSLNKGGAERVVCNLANYFFKCGNDVSIIITKDCERKYKLGDSIDVLVLDSGIKGGKMRNLRRIRKLHAILKELKPDLVFGFLQEPIGRLLVSKLLYADIRKIPIIVSVRIDPKTAFNNIKRRLSLPLYNLADGFVFQTEDAKSFFNESIRRRSVIIGNSVDAKFFMKRQNTKKRQKKIVSVGRLTEQKNYPMLIDAFGRLGDEFNDWSLEIYGDGSLRKELEDYIDSIGLTGRVILMGEVDDVDKRITDASLFVITSDYEGMSNALMEAMALGLPCISTNSAGGGAATLIKNGVNGFLVPVGDREKLCAVMKEVLSNDELLKKISMGSTISMKKYDPNVINDKWMEFAMKCIKSKGAQ